MSLASITLSQFRRFESNQIQFHPRTTILVGENASGKTSIMESIFLLSNGDSFRANKIEEMIRFGAEIGRVSGVLDQEEDPSTVEILLTRGMVQGKRTATRLYSLNGVRKRKKDVINKLFAVIFRPEDMRLVEGSPNRRRQFLDQALGGVHYTYQMSLKTYEQALTKRNKLLLSIREGEMPASVLTYWTQQLIKHGQIVQEFRQRLLDTFRFIDFPVTFSAEYTPSVISEERMGEYRHKEIAAGHTLIGPHKDDFIVQLQGDIKNQNNKFDVAIYGSRGQQRLAVLWLKLGELLYVEREVGQKPLLLLDDILSELDQESKSRVLTLLGTHQTVVSTADREVLPLIQQQTTDSLVLEMGEYQ